MLRKLQVLFLIPLIYIPSQAVLANENKPVTLANHLASLLSSSFVGTVSLGPDWASGGQTQTLHLAPGIDKTYTANKPNNTLTNLDIFLGIQRPLINQFQGQIGLNFANTTGANLTGNIWDDASPTFNNYTYQYKLKHNQLALKGKLLLDRHWPLIPWISLMSGIGFNQAYNFSNHPTIYEAVASPNFSDHTTTTFTYGFGIGAQYSLSKNWQAGMGYEWSDWGRSELGSVPSASNSQSLTLSHFYSSALMFNITYLASDQ